AAAWSLPERFCRARVGRRRPSWEVPHCIFRPVPSSRHPRSVAPPDQGMCARFALRTEARADRRATKVTAGVPTTRSAVAPNLSTPMAIGIAGPGPTRLRHVRERHQHLAHRRAKMSSPTQEPRFEIRNPLIIMFETEPDHTVVTHLYPSVRCDGYEAYGLLVCDLVRHVAKKFNVTEEE